MPDLGAQEVFCVVRPAHRRQGYASDALRSLMEHNAAGGGVREFHAYVDPSNRESVILAERIGLTFAGRGPHPTHGDESLVYSAEVVGGRS